MCDHVSCLGPIIHRSMFKLIRELVRFTQCLGVTKFNMDFNYMISVQVDMNI